MPSKYCKAAAPNGTYAKKTSFLKALNQKNLLVAVNSGQRPSKKRTAKP